MGRKAREHLDLVVVVVSRCGLLEHDLKECPESMGMDKVEGRDNLQYGAWLRGELAKWLGVE